MYIPNIIILLRKIEIARRFLVNGIKNGMT